MRRSLLAIISLTCLFTVASGCRQTTTGINGSQLTPISPLAPNNSLFPAPGSSVGPMGGSTRVPPPSTGSFSTPNNYLNGSTSQLGNPGAAGGFAATMPQDRHTDSNVQSAGWTETTTNLSNNSIAPTGFHNSPSPSLQPLAPMNQPASLPQTLPGGMQVIDLTTAPSPPGYRPASQPMYPGPVGYPQNGYPQPGYGQPGYGQPGTYNVTPNANIGYGVTNNYAGTDITARGTFAPQYTQQANNSPAPTYQAQSFQPASQPAVGFSGPPSNQAFQDVSSQYRAPQPQSSTMPSTQPRTATMPPAESPTTDPAANDLLWRRPGTRF